MFNVLKESGDKIFSALELEDYYSVVGSLCYYSSRASRDQVFFSNTNSERTFKKMNFEVNNLLTILK